MLEEKGGVKQQGFTAGSSTDPRGGGMSLMGEEDAMKGWRDAGMQPGVLKQHSIAFVSYTREQSVRKALKLFLTSLPFVALKCVLKGAGSWLQTQTNPLVQRAGLVQGGEPTNCCTGLLVGSRRGKDRNKSACYH